MSSVISSLLIICSLLALDTYCSSVVIGEVEYESLGSTIGPHTPIQPGQGLLSSNEAYALVLGYDGNLVIYSTWNDRNLWSTNTNDGQYLVYESDGDLRLYTIKSYPGDIIGIVPMPEEEKDWKSTSYEETLWSSNTDSIQFKHEIGQVVMQDDGYLIIVDKYGNLVWNLQQYSSYETVQFPFQPAESESACVVLVDTYPRSVEPVTCPDDKVSITGLCYDECRDGYSSYSVLDCIEDDCPAGYTDLGLVCEKWKECETCDKICIGVEPFRTCDTICVPYPCADVTTKHVYARLPSWPDQCPSDYHALEVGTVDALCYKSCKYGYIDTGVFCTCNPDVFFSDIEKYSTKFARFFDQQMTQLVDELNTLDCLVAGKTLDMGKMTPLLPAINVFMDIVDEIVNNNFVNAINAIANSNQKKIIVLEIGCGASIAASYGFGAFGYVFDPNTNKYSYYEGSYCAGINIDDPSLDVSVTLSFFDSINDVPGTSQLYGISGGIDGLAVAAEHLDKYLATGFSISYAMSSNFIPVGLSWHMCETPQLKDV